MMYFNIILPSKPRIISEEENKGLYEIEGLYPGYGHTLGNSIRRIILSSIPGFAITSVKIDGISHEFSTIDGIKEDVISIILNLKKIKFKVSVNEKQTVTLKVKGAKDVTAKDLDLPGQVEVINKDQHIATLTDKNASLDMEIVLEKGLGYLSKETLHKDKVDIGVIALDSTFTPVRRVSYEVENMRVGNRTDFNRLRIFVETDGTISSKEVLENSIRIMIDQLKAVVGFKEEDETIPDIKEIEKEAVTEEKDGDGEEDDKDALKTRVEDLDLSMRTLKALSQASIRTVGGLTRKKEEDLLNIDGLGEKGIDEIKKALSNFGITLK